jgi:predicted CXXCH cytochrome family protein
MPVPNIANGKKRTARLAAACTILAGIVGVLLSACSTVERTVVTPPEIEGATFVGNKGCVECHQDYTRRFPASEHGKFHKDDPKWAGVSGCESCHGPGSRHVAAGGGRRLIANPGREPEICFNCHTEIHAAFNLPHHHPLIEKRMNCVQCHDPHGRDAMKPAGGLAMSRLNESCAQCHREQARPHVFEHEAMREGCTTCHDPHGSINRKMLVQADNNLCLRCHAQVQSGSRTDILVIGKREHATFMQGRTCWAAGCHSAVHGSNLHSRLQY